MMNLDIIEPSQDRPTIEYEVVGQQSHDKQGGQYKIKFTNTAFDDIIFCIYGVSFEEHENEAVMKFNYDIIEGEVAESEIGNFKQLLGDFILQGIEAGLKTNSLVYTGGVDEN